MAGVCWTHGREIVKDITVSLDGHNILILPSLDDDPLVQKLAHISDEYVRTCRRFREHQNNGFMIFQNRHNKYGPGNISSMGHSGVMTRWHDKYERIQYSTEDFVDESNADAHYDGSNYSLIDLMVLNAEWPGITKADRIANIKEKIQMLQKELAALDSQRMEL